MPEFEHLTDEHFAAEKDRRDNARAQYWANHILAGLDGREQISTDESRSVFGAVIFAFRLTDPLVAMGAFQAGLMDANMWMRARDQQQFEAQVASLLHTHQGGPTQ